MIHPKADGTDNGTMTIRSIMLIDDEKRLQFLMHYPPSCGNATKLHLVTLVWTRRSADYCWLHVPA